MNHISYLNFPGIIGFLINELPNFYAKVHVKFKEDINKISKIRRKPWIQLPYWIK